MFSTIVSMSGDKSNVDETKTWLSSSNSCFRPSAGTNNIDNYVDKSAERVEVPDYNLNNEGHNKTLIYQENGFDDGCKDIKIRNSEFPSVITLSSGSVQFTIRPLVSQDVLRSVSRTKRNKRHR